ncbi:hypothetical protein BC830DRAFT_1145193 [Chytriomyces sp. MP71]|nr:hypothetical protein BC830DRAFT_1145193 [Chytriomyces sp. MP71]
MEANQPHQLSVPRVKKHTLAMTKESDSLFQHHHLSKLPPIVDQQQGLDPCLFTPVASPTTNHPLPVAFSNRNLAFPVQIGNSPMHPQSLSAPRIDSLLQHQHCAASLEYTMLMSSLMPQQVPIPSSMSLENSSSRVWGLEGIHDNQNFASGTFNHGSHGLVYSNLPAFLPAVIPQQTRGPIFADAFPGPLPGVSGILSPAGIWRHFHHHSDQTSQEISYADVTRIHPAPLGKQTTGTVGAAFFAPLHSRSELPNGLEGNASAQGRNPMRLKRPLRVERSEDENDDSDASARHKNAYKHNKRFRLPKQQMTLLKAAFEENPLPSPQRAQEIAEQLQVHVKKVQIW